MNAATPRGALAESEIDAAAPSSHGALSEAQIAALEAQHEPSILSDRKRGNGRERRKRPRSHVLRPTIADYVVLALLLAVGGWMGWQSLKLTRADFQTTKARAEVHSWSRGVRWTIEDWTTAEAELLSARATLPTDPVIHDLLGVMWTLRAREAWRNPAARALFYNQAAVHQRNSLALRQAHGWTWASLAESLSVVDARDDETWKAWRLARRYTPYEPIVQQTLLYVGISSWRAAPADIRVAMRTVYDTAPASVRAAANASAGQFKVAFR